MRWMDYIQVQQTNDMEEHLNDLKAQNETLMEKLQACASKQHENKSSSYSRDSTDGNQVLQEQNKSLSEQLLKSLHVYPSLKRRVKETQDENSKLHENMAEVTRSCCRFGDQSIPKKVGRSGF